MNTNIQNNPKDNLDVSTVEENSNFQQEVTSDDQCESACVPASQEPVATATEESLSTKELASDVPVEILKESATQNEILIEQDFNLELIDQSMSNVSAGQIVDGIVVGVDDKEILVDIGCKSEASIHNHEFLPGELPVKGDKIQVYVVTKESGDGKPVISKKRADFISNISKMKEAFQNNEIITGKLTRRVKGGMIVEVLGVEAFMPGSQIALKNVPNLDQFINKDFQMKIVRLDEDKKNIIVSRKKVLEAELEVKKEKLKEIIKINAELDGEVKNITDYGAFVDLGGIDGLLHVTDMSWGKINHPADMLNIGDKIKVKCLGYDESIDRVSLGIKQLVPHPWENIEAKFPEGTKVTGKVINLASYGAFVELEPGVEGLIHVSEMSWTKRISHSRQVVKIGETVNAIVLFVSKENQRISLGLKQMLPNPWLTIEKRYPEGMIINRTIKNITNFGAFVEIESEIDGLIHISDISWTKRIYHPKEILKKGQEVSTIVLSVDKLLHRISLGLKQMNTDPWDDILENMPVNTEVVGIVSKCIPKGLLVDIPYKNTFVEGFVPISHLAIPQIDKTEDAFEVNEKIDMKIIEVDIDNRRLILSIKAWFFSREKHELKEYQKIHLERASLHKEKTQKKESSQKKKDRKKRKAENENTDAAVEKKSTSGEVVFIKPEKRKKEDSEETIQLKATEADVEEIVEESAPIAAEVAVEEITVEEPAPIATEVAVEEITVEEPAPIATEVAVEEITVEESAPIAVESVEEEVEKVTEET